LSRIRGPKKKKKKPQKKKEWHAKNVLLLVGSGVVAPLSKIKERGHSFVRGKVSGRAGELGTNG